MEIILTKQCESLTGALGNGYGYFIQRRRGQDGKYHYFSQRSKHPPIPRDGHLRFIFTCAELAQAKLHISDIRVSGYELKAALQEDVLLASALCVDVDNEYSAAEVLQFKKERGL